MILVALFAAFVAAGTMNMYDPLRYPQATRQRVENTLKLIDPDITKDQTECVVHNFEQVLSAQQAESIQQQDNTVMQDLMAKVGRECFGYRPKEEHV